MVAKELPQRKHSSKIALTDNESTFSKSREWSPRISVHEEDWGVFTVPVFDFNLGFRNHLSDGIIYRNPPIKTTLGRFYIDERISNIYSTIVESRSLELYKDDWDSEGAIGFNEMIYDRAINILIKYSEYVLIQFDVYISSPEINIGRDGSIDLEWRHNNNILLINILNCDELCAHYYGHDLSSKTIIKGSLEKYDINEVIASFMKCLA